MILNSIPDGQPPSVHTIEWSVPGRSLVLSLTVMPKIFGSSVEITSILLNKPCPQSGGAESPIPHSYPDSATRGFLRLKSLLPAQAWFESAPSIAVLPVVNYESIGIVGTSTAGGRHRDRDPDESGFTTEGSNRQRAIAKRLFAGVSQIRADIESDDPGQFCSQGLGEAGIRWHSTGQDLG